MYVIIYITLAISYLCRDGCARNVKMLVPNIGIKIYERQSVLSCLRYLIDCHRLRFLRRSAILGIQCELSIDEGARTVRRQSSWEIHVHHVHIGGKVVRCVAVLRRIHVCARRERVVVGLTGSRSQPVA